MMNDGNSFALPALMPTRRQIIAGVAMAVGGAAFGATKARAGADEEISHAAESIHQEVLFKASRKRVYDALTISAQFDKVTQIGGASPALGSAATAIKREAGGAFSLFGGHVVGRQIELVPNDRIVQAWRAGDWATGVYSIAKFELVEQGPGTKLVFDHTGFPKGAAEHLAEGWKGHYWEPLEKFLAPG